MSHWVNVWRCISDCSHVLPTGTPFHQRCLEAFAYALYQTGERGWQSQTVMSGAAIWSHNPALEYWHSTEQYWYTCISLPGPDTAQIYLFIVIPSSLSNKEWPCNNDNTFLSTYFGANASRHQTSFITFTSWDLFWVIAEPRWTIIYGKLQPLWFQGYLVPLVPVRVAVLKPRYDLIRKQNLVSEVYLS